MFMKNVLLAHKNSLKQRLTVFRVAGSGLMRRRGPPGALLGGDGSHAPGPEPARGPQSRSVACEVAGATCLLHGGPCPVLGTPQAVALQPLGGGP